MAKIEAFEQLKTFFGRLTSGQRTVLFLTVVAVIAGLVLLFSVTKETTDYAVLFSSLETADASKIVQKLQEKQIPYQLSDNGNTILIDRKKLYETRLSLAAEGLPETSVVGYEIFDKTNLGMSEFVQKINYRRALEGELSRTISSMEEIKTARVQIVIPEKALFDKDQKQPTASVTLHLKPGHSLTKGNIEGIQKLVASSVEGMSSGEVTIIDERGKILSEAPLDAGSTAGLTASQHEQQKHVEQYISGKVQSLLDGVLGSGNSQTQVNAELDFTQIEKTITDYNPEKQAVRSEQTINDDSKSMDSLSYPAVNMARNSSNAIANYEIPKTVEKIVQEVGNVKRLSVAVMINGVTKVIDVKGIKTLQYSPRSDEEMQKLTQIVKNAVGYDPSRNDQVSVLNVPFDTTPLEEDIQQAPKLQWWQDPENIKLIVLLFGMLATIFLMYRLLQSKPIKDRLRLALSLPDKIEVEDEEPDTRQEELEELVMDDDDMLMLPAELPEQLLLEGDRSERQLEAYEEDEGVLDKNTLAERARAKLDMAGSAELSEETLMKLELKTKIQEYLDKDTQDAIKLVRMLLAQDYEEKSSKY